MTARARSAICSTPRCSATIPNCPPASPDAQVFLVVGGGIATAIPSSPAQSPASAGRKTAVPPWRVSTSVSRNWRSSSRSASTKWRCPRISRRRLRRADRAMGDEGAFSSENDAEAIPSVIQHPARAPRRNRWRHFESPAFQGHRRAECRTSCRGQALAAMKAVPSPLRWCGRCAGN